MKLKTPCEKKEVIIRGKLGLHARPAAMIAKIVRNADKDVWLVDGNKRADASSVIDILTLEALKGNLLTVEIDSKNDAHILDALVNYFESGFGEDTDGGS